MPSPHELKFVCACGSDIFDVTPDGIGYVIRCTGCERVVEWTPPPGVAVRMETVQEEDNPAEQA
jgi:hypothetical protein